MDEFQDEFQFNLRSTVAITIYVGVLLTARFNALAFGFVGMVGAAVLLVLLGMKVLKCPLWTILTALVVFTVWFVVAASLGVTLVDPAPDYSDLP